MELRTFGSLADVESYISDLVANDMAYHFDDDEYELFDSELAVFQHSADARLLRRAWH